MAAFNLNFGRLKFQLKASVKHEDRILAAFGDRLRKDGPATEDEVRGELVKYITHVVHAYEVEQAHKNHEHQPLPVE